MAEQAGGGTGERVLNPAIGRPGNPGLRSVRRPGARLATGTRAASGLRPGAISPCQELADGGWSRLPKVAADVLARKAGRSRTQRGPPVPKSAARRRKENAAAERREARRWAIPPAISGDPEIGPTARRATGAAFRTSACRRSAPLIFSRGRKRTKGSRRPPQSGR